MAIEAKHQLYNQPGRAVRMLCWIAVVLLALSVPFILRGMQINARGGPTAHDDAIGWQVGGMVTVCFAVAALLSALLTLPSALRARRNLAAFQAGEYLVHWEYSGEFWDGVVAETRARIGRAAWGIFVIVWGFCLFVAMMPIWASPDVVRKVFWTCAAVPGCAAVGWATYCLARWYQTRKCRRMIHYPDAMIGRRAAYYAGDYVFWGTRLRSLHSLKITNEGWIEFVVGMSSSVSGVTAVVDLVNLSMLHPTNASQQVTRLKIPIPPGENAKAAEVVKAIIENSQAKPKAEK